MTTWLFRRVIDVTLPDDEFERKVLGPLRLGIEFSIPCPHWMASIVMWLQKRRT